MDDMSAIANIDSIYQLPPLSGKPAASTSARASIHEIRGDVAEISELGRAMARSVEESSLRLAYTRAIRAQIENGTYETAERIDATAQRLLDVIA